MRLYPYLTALLLASTYVASSEQPATKSDVSDMKWPLVTFDWGDSNGGRAWADFTGDGKADFCRALGTQYGLCTSFAGKAPTDIRSEPLDSGYPDTRAWIDINDDGKADFCRVTGDLYPRTFLECTWSDGDHFSKESRKVGPIDAGDPATGRYWARVTGEKTKVQYCRRVGAELVCTTLNGSR